MSPMEKAAERKRTLVMVYRAACRRRATQAWAWSRPKSTGAPRERSTRARATRWRADVDVASQAS
jgi:hypothetical protein